MTSSTSSNKRRRWRSTSVGAVVLSWDFLAALPLGLLAGWTVSESCSAQENMQGVLLALAAIGAGVVGLVLTALTLLLSAISPAYQAILKQAPSGFRGAALPYRQVIFIAAVGSVVSILAATLWAEIEVSAWGVFTATSIAVGLSVWSILGCVQVIEELVKHMERRNRADDMEARRRAAGERS